MALSLRGRPSRSVRLRGRNDSGEENVPLDLSREPSDNLREILQNVTKAHGVSNMRKLGHLNNFVKLLNSVDHHEEKLGFSYEEIIICLRLALLNEVKEVRAAGLRALRYLIRDRSVLQKVLQLQVDYLISRCLDIQQSNEVEQTQALRLLTRIIAVDAALFPSSVTNSLVAVGNNGLHEHEKDHVVLACNAILCELAVKNPELVAGRGGLSTLLKNVLDCQHSRINEALISTVLHLLNHPQTRQYVRADVELEQILAPYTDFHYRHNPDTTEAQLKTDREARFSASKMAIVAAFRSWSGIINLCKVGNSGIQSLIGLLCIPNMEIRKALLEVLYEIFRLPVPMVTADFEEALHSIDPSRPQDSWRLGDGFVAAEAKVLLPHRARSRPDLLDNYLALILSTLFSFGLLEGLVEVVTSSDDVLSVRATVLLGELLHMASSLLPHSHSHHLHCLPTLINMAASFDISPEKRLRASAAVTQLKRLHELKKRSPKPHSLYLQLILKQSSHRDSHRSHRDGYIFKDTEDALMMNLRDSQILNHKQNLEWNWVLISTVLKWPHSNLRNYRDEQVHKFVRRLLYFYKPSSKLYCVLELEHPKAPQLTLAGCQLINFLLDSDDDGQVYLEDLVKDIVQWLSSFSGLKSERSLQSNGLLSTLSQHYFLFLGTLSGQPSGVKTMEKCGAFQCLLNLCSMKNQDALLKLTVSTLDYSRDGLARIILSKILTAGSDNCRLYATKHLRVLLRANVEFFSNWGIELLVTQLPDHSKAVSMEALDILDEACEEKANLHALIHMKPALTHLGDKGLLLLLRFLSIPKGFSYLNERGYVSQQLEKWHRGNVSARSPFNTWVWKSELPLQCADNSVRVRRVFSSTAVSAWSQWATHHGSSTGGEPLPTSAVSHLKAAQVTEIRFKHKSYHMTPVDEHVRAIKVFPLEFQELPVNLACKDSANSVKDQTVVNYITFPPEKPQNLSCMTRNLQTITCKWECGLQLDVDRSLHRRRYSLRVQDSGEAEVQCGLTLRCDFAALPGRIFYNISVMMRNALGEESQSYAFNISQRVFPVPEYVVVSPGATDVEVSWYLIGNFTGLHFICQITMEPTGKTTERQFVVSEPEQSLRATVQPLQPSSQYSTTVRCALQDNDWGSWSSNTNFSTEPLVTVDIWTRIRRQAYNCSLAVLWNTFNSASDSNIKTFEVCVAQDSTRSRECVNVKETKVYFTVGFGQCNVSVRAVTLRGSSITSYMSVHPGWVITEPMLKEKRIVGNPEGFLLSWSAISSATCGYAVEWCTMSNAEPCDLRWRKVSANQTSLSLSAEGFRKGHRYTFKIFSCQTEGHQVHEKHTGYLVEQEPLSAPELSYSLSILSSSMLLQWSFNEEDSEHPGFITGYRLTIQEHADWTYSNRFWNISVEDPHRKSVKVEEVKEGQRYTIQLAACTRAGCGPESIRTITTPQNHYLLMAKVMTPLLILIGCCFCLWPCKETLKGIAVDIFSFPSGQRMKVLELDDSLFEVSEMLRVLQVEDCKCCNLDSVDMRSSMEEKSWLIFTEERCKPAGPSLSEEELAWDELAAERVTSVTNLTYLSSLAPRSASPALESSRSHRANYVPSLNTNDYVTSFNTDEYVTPVSPDDYITSFNTGDYFSSIKSGSPGNHVTSVSTVTV
ncbi:hypothetical protein MHYP_G00264030 [Metynnis hypsauchen]